MWAGLRYCCLYTPINLSKPGGKEEKKKRGTYFVLTNFALSKFKYANYVKSHHTLGPFRKFVQVQFVLACHFHVTWDYPFNESKSYVFQNITFLDPLVVFCWFWLRLVQFCFLKFWWILWWPPFGGYDEIATQCHVVELEKTTWRGRILLIIFWPECGWLVHMLRTVWRRWFGENSIWTEKQNPPPSSLFNSEDVKALITKLRPSSDVELYVCQT